MKAFKAMMVAAILAAMVLAPGLGGSVLADVPLPPQPGYVEGIGTFFEVTDSDYLNVTLESSESIDLVLLSAPYAIDMQIRPDTAASAEITLTGLAADTSYYFYQDDGMDPIGFTTDGSGSYGFSLDLAEPHVVWIQPGLSTYQIFDSPSGGQCTAIGTWDDGTKTCTLTQDVSDAISIQSSGLTLDGAGYEVSPPSPANSRGIYVPNQTGVTVKNVSVANAVRGIYVWRGGSNTVTDCTVSILPDGEGIHLAQNSYSLVTHNTVSGNGASNGLILLRTGNSLVVHNSLSAGFTGAALFQAHYNIITGNTFSVPTGVGLYGGSGGGGVRYCTAYNNNFLNTADPIQFLGGAFNTFNLDAPDGGNYYSNYDEAAEGCTDGDGDGFCDAPYVFTGGQDDLPLTRADQRPIADADGPYMAEAGSSITLAGSASDPNGDPLAFLWSAEAGSFADASLADAVYSAPGEAGIYAMELTATDPGGLSDTATTYVVVYDVGAGFVTGGGWIYSEAGWCQLDEVCAGAEGKANFGFVSTYKKNAPPEGNTEFNLSAGGLNLHSTGYEWLIIDQNGTSAQYQGSGTVNGQASPSGEPYLFKVSVGDGDPEPGDTFRIKIWYEDGGEEIVVYDNSSDQSIGGGSIVIHAK